MARSALVGAATTVGSMSVLLAGTRSGVSERTAAVFVMTAPSSSVGATCTASVSVVVAPAASVATEQTTSPAAPTAGVVQLRPGAVSEANAVPVGSGSLTTTFAATLGPLLRTTSV